ncbi:MAG TPA: peptide deformylase [Gemmatimonadaceae bacterium]|nr:peptide deformylase [Gemmatimonadaceae bacterium]
MAVLPIHVLGSPVLREETAPVSAVTSDLLRLADDMIETMHAAQGVGLAAPQVGRTERLCVVEVEEEKHVLFNPEIVVREGEIKWEEGCLSIPEVYGDVMRAARVVVRATGRDGRPFEVEGTELFGVCLQHEIDHLHGRLFIDHLSYLKKRRAMQAWEAERVKYPNLLRILAAAGPASRSEAAAAGGGDRPEQR